jgi:signal transduction histidine kinase
LREGNGLSGIRERVAALGGDLRLGTAPRGGLRLDVRLPA